MNNHLAQIIYTFTDPHRGRIAFYHYEAQAIASAVAHLEAVPFAQAIAQPSYAQLIPQPLLDMMIHALTTARGTPPATTGETLEGFLRQLRTRAMRKELEEATPAPAPAQSPDPRWEKLR